MTPHQPATHLTNKSGPPLQRWGTRRSTVKQTENATQAQHRAHPERNSSDENHSNNDNARSFGITPPNQLLLSIRDDAGRFSRKPRHDNHLSAPARQVTPRPFRLTLQLQTGTSGAGWYAGVSTFASLTDGPVRHTPAPVNKSVCKQIIRIGANPHNVYPLSMSMNRSANAVKRVDCCTDASPKLFLWSSCHNERKQRS